MCGWTANAPLSWTVVVPSGLSGMVKLYGYRDERPRAYRVRVDGGAWTAGVQAGPSAPSARFHTSAPLPAGPHRFDLELVATEAFTFDFFELGTAEDPAPAAAPLVFAPGLPAPTALTPHAPAPVSPTPAPAPSDREAAPTPALPAPTPAPAQTVSSGEVCAIAPRRGAPAIAAAIRGCPDGSIVRFPPNKRYAQADTIEVKDRADLVIDGNGSTFTSSVPNDQQRRPNWRLLRDDRVVIKRMTVVGNFKSAGPRRVQPDNQLNAGVSIDGGTSVTVRDLAVNDVWGDMVVTLPSGYAENTGALSGEVPTDVHVERLRGRRAARMCVAFTAAKGAWLEDSTLEDCWYGGIDLEVDVLGQPMHDVHILRNKLSGFFIAAIMIPYYGQAGDVADIEIRDNETLTVQDACWPVLQTKDTRDGRDGGETAANIIIENNRFKTITSGMLIRDVLSGSVAGNDIEMVTPRPECGTPARPVIVEGSAATVTAGRTVGFG